MYVVVVVSPKEQGGVLCDVEQSTMALEDRPVHWGNLEMLRILRAANRKNWLREYLHSRWNPAPEEKGSRCVHTMVEGLVLSNMVCQPSDIRVCLTEILHMAERRSCLPAWLG